MAWFFSEWEWMGGGGGDYTPLLSLWWHSLLISSWMHPECFGSPGGVRDQDEGLLSLWREGDDCINKDSEFPTLLCTPSFSVPYVHSDVPCLLVMLSSGCARVRCMHTQECQPTRGAKNKPLEEEKNLEEKKREKESREGGKTCRMKFCLRAHLDGCIGAVCRWIICLCSIDF